jgi:hypothetical protein
LFLLARLTPPVQAIAGNDLTSSVLYTVGFCSARAGQLSPLCLLLVSVVLFFYRYVYGDLLFASPLCFCSRFAFVAALLL